MDLTTRITVRLSPEDEAWVAEQATDEGVDNATFVRMLINRLRRGRPALMRTAIEIIESASVAPHGEAAAVMFAQPSELNDLPSASAEDILALRLQESGLEASASLNGGDDQQWQPNGAAVSHRHIPRESFNPPRT